MDSKEWGDYGPTQGCTRTERQVTEHQEHYGYCMPHCLAEQK